MRIIIDFNDPAILAPFNAALDKRIAEITDDQLAERIEQIAKIKIDRALSPEKLTKLAEGALTKGVTEALKTTYGCGPYGSLGGSARFKEAVGEEIQKVIKKAMAPTKD